MADVLVHLTAEQAAALEAKCAESGVTAEEVLRGAWFLSGDIRTVEWVDSSLQNGQVAAPEFPEPVVVRSVGFVVKETVDYVVLARDDMGHDGDFRGLCAIPKLAVKT